MSARQAVTVLERIQAIGTETMGTGSFPASDLERYAAEEESFIEVCEGETKETRPVTAADLGGPPEAPPIRGFCIGGVYDMDRVADELYADIDELHANSPLCEERYPVAYYRDLAVAPEFQGDRVATRLVHTLASKLLSESTNIIAPIWHRPDSPTDEMLDKYPAEHFHTFSEYDLHRSGAACPVCPDDGDCTCEFSVYGLLGG